MTDNIRKYSLDNIDNEKEFTQWIRSLKTIKSTNLHALILEYDQVEKKREQNKKYSYIEELPPSLQFEEKQKVNYEDNQDKTILDIHVSPLKRKSAYAFVNRLLTGFELLGGQVYIGYEKDYYTELQLPYVSWKIQLFEKKVRGNTKEVMQPVYRKNYSGILQIELINLENKKKFIFTDEAEQELIRARQETEKLAKEQEELKAKIDEKRNVLKEEIFDHIEYLDKIKKIESYLHTVQSISYDDEETKKILQNYVEKVQSLYNLNKFTNIIELWNSKFD